MRYSRVFDTVQQAVEPFLLEEDLSDAEVGPAFAKVVGKDGFVPGQLAFDEMGADFLVSEGGFL